MLWKAIHQDSSQLSERGENGGDGGKGVAARDPWVWRWGENRKENKRYMKQETEAEEEENKGREHMTSMFSGHLATANTVLSITLAYMRYSIFCKTRANIFTSFCLHSVCIQVTKCVHTQHILSNFSGAAALFCKNHLVHIFAMNYELKWYYISSTFSLSFLYRNVTSLHSRWATNHRSQCSDMETRECVYSLL